MYFDISSPATAHARPISQELPPHQAQLVDADVQLAATYAFNNAHVVELLAADTCVERRDAARDLQAAQVDRQLAARAFWETEGASSTAGRIIGNAVSKVVGTSAAANLLDTRNYRRPELHQPCDIDFSHWPLEAILGHARY